MTVPPPRSTLYTLRRNVTGAAVHSLQKALGLTTDAFYGARTEDAVLDYQAKVNLTRDGVAGPATQQRLVRSLVAQAQGDLPKGLAKALILGESGGLIGAVNWSVKGGVDYGYCQRRVYASSWQEPWPDYSAQFPAADLERAYDPLYQVKLLVTRVRSSHDTFLTRSAVHSSERAWRLAVLQHNWPYGAQKLSTTREADLSSYWTTPQKWVMNIGALFDDGAAVQDPLSWAKFYSLGAPEHNHEGTMVKGTVWT